MFQVTKIDSLSSTKFKDVEMNVDCLFCGGDQCECVTTNRNNDHLQIATFVIRRK